VRLGPAQRWCVSLALLGGLVFWLDPGKIFAEIGNLSPAWLALALAISFVQTCLSAWRWRFTAGRLGLSLSPARALTDYYLAGFINQILPGGVLGDAWRAQRHARRSGRKGAAWRAVILERASGQTIVVVLALLAVLFHEPWRQASATILFWAVVVVSIVILMVLFAWRRMRNQLQWIGQFQADAYQALFRADAWPAQVASSLLIVLSYLLVFAAGARGIGIAVPLPELLLMALPILLAMLVPVSVAGWGVREGAAGLVWWLSGLAPEQGVAAAIAYGLLVLLGSLPGAIVLLWPDSAQPNVNQ